MFLSALELRMRICWSSLQKNRFLNAIWAQETTFMGQFISDFVADLKYVI